MTFWSYFVISFFSLFFHQWSHLHTRLKCVCLPKWQHNGGWRQQEPPHSFPVFLISSFLAAQSFFNSYSLQMKRDTPWQALPPPGDWIMALCSSSPSPLSFLAKEELGWKEAALLERKVLRMWVGGKRRGGEGEGEQSSVGALTGRGADRPRRGRVIEMCFYSGGRRSQRRRREGEKLQGKKEKMRAAAEIKRTGVSWKSNMKTLLAKQDTSTVDTHTHTHSHTNWRLRFGYDWRDDMNGRLLLACCCSWLFLIIWTKFDSDYFGGETFESLDLLLQKYSAKNCILWQGRWKLCATVDNDVSSIFSIAAKEKCVISSMGVKNRVKNYTINSLGFQIYSNV